MKNPLVRIFAMLTLAIIVLLIYSYQTGWNPLPELDKYNLWRTEIGEGDFSVSITKITSIEDIPEHIFEKISQLDANGELGRGYWYFNPEFYKVDYFYFMVCGGVDYTEKYDVNIVDYTYEYANPNINRADHEHIFGDLICDITVDELFNNANDYRSDFTYPLVIFKVNERDADNMMSINITSTSEIILERKY